MPIHNLGDHAMSEKESHLVGKLHDLERRGKFEQMYQKGLEYSEKHPEFYRVRLAVVSALIGLERLTEAESLVNQIEETFGLKDSIVYYKSYVAMEQGETQRSKELLRKAIDLVPEGEDIVKSSYYSVLGVHLLEIDDDVDAAKEALKVSLTLNPHNTLAAEVLQELESEDHDEDDEDESEDDEQEDEEDDEFEDDEDLFAVEDEDEFDEEEEMIESMLEDYMIMFYDIQKQKYFDERGLEKFSSRKEESKFEHAVEATWNNLLRTDAGRITSMSEEELSELFNSMSVDPENPPEFKVVPDLGEDAEEMFNQVFPFLPPGGFMRALIAHPVLKHYGIEQEKLNMFASGELMPDKNDIEHMKFACEIGTMLETVLKNQDSKKGYSLFEELYIRLATELGEVEARNLLEKMIR
jgi:tetratricopeptide (TPR) repeat protein